MRIGLLTHTGRATYDLAIGWGGDSVQYFADIEIQANEILHHKLTLNGYLAEFTGETSIFFLMSTFKMLSLYSNH